MATNGNRKVAQSFFCESCHYNTSKKSNYEKHILTAKHQKCYKINNLSSVSNQKVAKVANDNIMLFCNKCNKYFSDRSGLWRHNKKCNVTCNDKNDKSMISNINDKEIIMTLIKENSELKNMMMDTQNKMLETQTKMMDVLEKGTHNTNSHNKTFNLQFFLNDTCIDAMNIMDFVNNLQLQLTDLEKMGEIGYVNGISNIIVKNLKDMDVTARPIHCTDVKREVLYIKDEDKWDKEANDHPKVRNIIKHIAHKNSKLLNEFKEKYPDYNNSSSKISDQYNKILIETMGGKGDNDYEKETKIIKNLSKEVVLDK